VSNPAWRPLYNRIWDVTDIIVPPVENNAFFITTNIVITPNQAYIHAVLRIRIHMFLGLLDPDPLVRGMDPDPDPALDPDPSIFMQK
jgi:hypothetical protein